MEYVLGIPKKVFWKVEKYAIIKLKAKKIGDKREVEGFYRNFFN